MSSTTDVAIIGAGPYGLSIAAHLAKAGVDLRVFGKPMETWSTSMPKGMVLKSEGFASSLYDPDGRFPLSAFCAERGLPYADIGYPIPLDTFVDYGTAFQERFVPGLDERMVASVEPAANGFALRTDDGEIVSARRVVIAAGIRHFDYIPPLLAQLPRPYVSHSAEHRDLEGFAGQDVIVVGAGASAGNLVALLHEAGARPTLVARRPKIGFCGPPVERTLRDKVTAPLSGLGTGWRSWMCTTAPLVFHAMPEQFRVMVTTRHLGPSPGWTVQEQVDRLPKILGSLITCARLEDGRAHLGLRLMDGQTKEVSTDRIIAATGYKVNLKQLTFLGEKVQAGLKSVESTPRLSRHFESSVPGLYFVGTVAANSFGPMLRFAYGAGFAARRLTRHLTQAAAHNRAPSRTVFAGSGSYPASPQQAGAL